MNKFRHYFEIILGNFLLAAAVNYFILPYNILTGGLAGIANVINAIVPIHRVLLINILDIAFFLIGVWVLGKEFALNTALSTIVYPIILSVLSFLPYDVHCSPVSASVLGGIISGVGLGIVFRNFASTGGTDVPIMILHKYTGIDFSDLELWVDGAIAVLGILIVGLDAVLIGLLSIFVSSLIIDRVAKPKTSNSSALFIISDDPEPIKDFIHTKLARGSTIFDVRGGYKGDPRSCIMVVVSRKQYETLVKFINEEDPDAFIFVAYSKEVIGEGFTYSRV